ncbi:MAG TPA: ion channel [Flavitalea sp.]|nr:ion channel [Flavitalea sp.]
MASSKHFNLKATADETTGFGTNSSMYGGRLVKKDGRPNIRKSGLKFFERLSWYHTLIDLPRSKFLALILLGFLLINLLYALCYYMIGVDHLNGMVAETKSQKFIEAFFFSAQTFTTVGYGRINPTGYITSMVAAVEALTGLLFFAIATGLFYARFSRPKAFIRFSESAVIAPYKDGIAYMFRLVPFKNNMLTDAEVKVTIGLVEKENGKEMNRFYPMELEINRINALTLSWTIVHPINDKSPLFNLSKENLLEARAEILVYLKAFDETFSNTVVARASYTADELIVGAKFIPMYHRSPVGNYTVIELAKLNAMQKVELPVLV